MGEAKAIQLENLVLGRGLREMGGRGLAERGLNGWTSGEEGLGRQDCSVNLR